LFNTIALWEVGKCESNPGSESHNSGELVFG